MLDKCCYCEALNTEPQHRSGAMTAVLDSEALQLEAGKHFAAHLAPIRPAESASTPKSQPPISEADIDVLEKVR